MKIKKKLAEKKEAKHRARRLFIKEGIFISMRNSFGQNYISPFAIAINTSSPLVAMLSSISGLLGPLSQMFGSRLIEKFTRKKILLKSSLSEILIWFSFILIAFLFYQRIFTPLLPFVLLILFSAFIVVANIPYPAIFSWLGDLVDKKYRGRWFSKRDFIRGFVGVILALLGAFLLDWFDGKGIVMVGFMILFLLASFGMFLAFKTTKREYEPKINLKKGDYFSFFKFLRNAPKNNFGRFSIFGSFFAFSHSMSASLITVYLLRYLEFNYITYMVITLSFTIFSLAFLGFWGKFSDKYGNYKIMLITTVLIPLIPIFYILFPSPLYLIFVPQLVAGIAWSGFNLATVNFIPKFDSFKKS